MEQTLEQWLADLESTELPAFAIHLETLAGLTRDDNVRVGQLAAVIERDPGLTLRLLRRINAVNHKHLRTEVTTVSHALMMMGMGALGSLSQDLPTVEAIEDKRLRAKLRHLYARCYHAACQARDWARYHKEMEPDESFTATLLHDLAELLLWRRAPESMERLEKLKHGDEMEAEEAEYVVFGFGLNELTSRLCKQWGLPSLVADSVHPENTGKRRVLGIMLADRLARAAEKTWYSAETTAVIEEIADYLPLSFGVAANRIHRTAVDAAPDIWAMRVRPAAARLLWPSRPEAEPGLARETSAADPKPFSGSAEFCLCPQPVTYRSVLERLAGEVKVERPLQALLELALRGMHEGLALNRVLFALLTPAKTELRARAAMGAENDTRFNNLTIDLETENLFTRLLERPQALWLDEKNRETFLPLLPKGFRETVGVDCFFVISVFVKGQPVGAFYADRHRPDCRLDARAYHRFKQLAMQAAKAMAPLVKG